MADITPLIPAGKQVIDGYGGGKFAVSNQQYDATILVLPDSIELFEDVKAFSDITEQHIERLASFADLIDVLLVGCGETQTFFPRELDIKLKEKHIVAETMDTGAACRTYNVLLSEERAVGALLLPI